MKRVTPCDRNRSAASRMACVSCSGSPPGVTFTVQSGMPMDAACARSTRSGMACIVERPSAPLTVVRSDTTSYFSERRAVSSASAESLPPLQLKTAFMRASIPIPPSFLL